MSRHSPESNKTIIPQPTIDIPPYLLPPGYSLAPPGSILPLQVDIPEADSKKIFLPDFIKLHTTISTRYLQSTFKEFEALPPEKQQKIAEDYSVHILGELLTYHLLLLGAQDENLTEEFAYVLNRTPNHLSFNSFLKQELTEIVSQLHPMFSHINQSDIDQSITLTPQSSPSPEELAFIINITDPASLSGSQRNHRIQKKVGQALSFLNLSQKLELLTEESTRQQFIKTIPWLI